MYRPIHVQGTQLQRQSEQDRRCLRPTKIRFFCSSPENKGRCERSERKDLILSPIERRQQMNWLHGIEAMPFNARELMNCHPCLCRAMRGSEGA